MPDFIQTYLAPHVVQLQNNIGNCCTLVLGREKALLFDTMSGVGDLKGCVRSLTRLPLVVVNSHGHFDHMGGNYQFDPAYASPADWPLLPRFESRLKEIGENAGADLSPSVPSYHMPMLPLEPGMVWDLGGVTALAVALPGHTPGSMGLLLQEDRLLLAGDALSPEMCLFFPESLAVKVYQETLQKVMAMDITGFVQGHYSRVFPGSLLQKLLDCARLPGTKKGFPYTNSLIPSLRGLMYIYEFRNPDAGGTICIITKEEERCP